MADVVGKIVQFWQCLRLSQ